MRKTNIKDPTASFNILHKKSIIFFCATAKSGIAVCRGLRLAACVLVLAASLACYKAGEAWALDIGPNEMRTWGSVEVPNTTLLKDIVFTGNTGEHPGILQFLDGTVFSGDDLASQRLNVGANYATFNVDTGIPLIIEDNTYSSGGANLYGGVVFVNTNGRFDKTGDGTMVFDGNTVTGTTSASGGAIANYGIINLEGPVIFTNNMASGQSGAGGAIHSTGTYGAASVTVSGSAAFTNNTASGTIGNGGAIYNGNGSVLNLSATSADDTILFSGNMARTTPNSIFIHYYGTLNVGGAGTVDMRDPMTGVAFYQAGTSSTIAINKTGAGVWKMGGTSSFAYTMSSTAGKTEFTVAEGTLHLYRAGEVENEGSPVVTGNIGIGGVTTAGLQSYFRLSDGATLSMGGDGHLVRVTNGLLAIGAC